MIKQYIKSYIFTPKRRASEFAGLQLAFGGSVIIRVLCVKNLPMFFDSTFIMGCQIYALTKSRYFQLRNIGKIRFLIREDVNKTLVRTLITPRFVYRNTLLYGVNSASLQRIYIASHLLNM